VSTALAQTHRDLEVIVVVDGRDEATVRVLGALDDPRLRVVVPDRHLGNAAARNLGVARARGRWIGFLDDDDEWMPGKLEAQLAAGESACHRLPVVSCRMLGRSEAGVFRWPRRLPRRGEPVCEYLFCRRTPFTGEGAVQTSTILAPIELLRRVPFSEGMPRYVDLDWLLRASRVDGVGLVFPEADAPLSVWSMDLERPRLSNRADPDYTLAWARGARDLLTRRAYAAFLLTIASTNAAKAGRRTAFWRLTGEAIRHGRPNAAELATHVANFALSQKARRRVGALWAARARGPG
jgi:glycosyltransferase involved in cell wall biosynthesis